MEWILLIPMLARYHISSYYYYHASIFSLTNPAFNFNFSLDPRVVLAVNQSMRADRAN
jgi:hypothetical protein